MCTRDSGLRERTCVKSRREIAGSGGCITKEQSDIGINRAEIWIPIEFTCVPRVLVQSPWCPPGFSNCLVLSIDANTHVGTHNIHTRSYIYPETHVARSRRLISRAEVAYGLVDPTVLKRAWHNVLSSRTFVCPRIRHKYSEGKLLSPRSFYVEVETLVALVFDSYCRV